VSSIPAYEVSENTKKFRESQLAKLSEDIKSADQELQLAELFEDSKIAGGCSL
jgi:hypothetical protein